MAFTEDLSLFLSGSDFAVSATVGAATVLGVFDKPHLSALGGAVGTTDPSFTLKSSDVSANSIARGTTLTISGTAYSVREIEPDGTGMTTLLLGTD